MQVPQKWLILGCFCSLASEFTNGAAKDETFEVGGYGKEVVDAVVRRIRRSQIFSDDYDFMRRVAFLETEFGVKMNPSDKNYNGGIWALSEMDLNLTKNERLSRFHRQIASAFDIDWRKVKWNELLKPFYSGMAARLHLQNFAPSVPQTISKQAVLWEKIYSKREATPRNYTEYIKRINELENQAAKCNGMMDLTVVLDGSGSVGLKDFEISKEFVTSLFASYDYSLVRKGFIVFGDEAYMIFPLDSAFTNEEVTERVRSLQYPSEATNTNAGIMMAVEMIRSTRERASAPSILIVFTDGESNVGDGVSNIKLAEQEKIITFAIGIGPRLNESELLELAHNDSSHVMVVHDFQTLKTLKYRLNAEACLVSQKPDFGEVVKDRLKRNESRYYQYPLPETGITVIKNVSDGAVQGYFSFSEQNPSKAIHDGVLNDKETYIPPRTDPLSKFTSSESTETGSGFDNTDQLFIGMHGESEDSDYNVVCYEGDDDGTKLSKLTTTTTPRALLPTSAAPASTESDSDQNADSFISLTTTTATSPVTSPVTSDPPSTSGITASTTQASASNPPTARTPSSTQPPKAPSTTTPLVKLLTTATTIQTSTQYPSKFTLSTTTTPKPTTPYGSGTSVFTPSPADSAGALDSRNATSGNSNVNDGSNASGNSGNSTSPNSDSSQTDFANRQITSTLNSRYGNMGKCKDNYVGFLPFPGRCDMYTLCACGVRVLLECAPGLYFDADLGTCNFIQLVKCTASPFAELYVQG